MNFLPQNILNVIDQRCCIDPSDPDAYRKWQHATMMIMEHLTNMYNPNMKEQEIELLRQQIRQVCEVCEVCTHDNPSREEMAEAKTAAIALEEEIWLKITNKHLTEERKIDHERRKPMLVTLSSLASTSNDMEDSSDDSNVELSDQETDDDDEGVENALYDDYGNPLSTSGLFFTPQSGQSHDHMM